MRILIIGKDSFIGTNYIRYSINKEIREVSLIIHKPYEIDYKNIDIVLHLVAIVHQTKSISESDYFRVNHDLCIQTAIAAKKAGVKQLIFLSTIKVYGQFKTDIKEWDENSECFPDDSYGRSKYQAELDLKQLEDENFTVSIIRTPLVYGDGVKANMLSIIKLVNTFPILPFRNTNNTRYFTYIENLVAYIDRIIEKRASGVFIAMDETPVSTTELVVDIAKHLEKKVYLFRLPKWMLKIGLKLKPAIFDRLYGSFVLNNTQTLKKLDFVPPYSTQEGIKLMVQSYRNRKNGV